MVRSNPHLNCSDRNILCISFEFLPWKMSRIYSIYNIQMFQKQSHLHTKFPTKMGCNYRRRASTAQAPEKQAKPTTVMCFSGLIENILKMNDKGETHFSALLFVSVMFLRVKLV